MATQTLQNDNTQAAFQEALERARKIAAKMGEEKNEKRSSEEDNSFGAQLAALQQQKASQNKTLVSEEYSVPDKMVGLIIGKGGENIVKIQRETGVLSVQFAQDSAGSPDRKCTITGPPTSIDKAKEMIDQMIEKAKTTLIPAPTSALVGGEEETIVSVGIPADKVGLVIGKSGDNIKKLQEEAGVRMVMIQDGIYANAPEKELRIMGVPERIEKAKELVAELLAQHGYNFDNEYNPQLQGPYLTKEQVIPKCAIGLIIGKNGETIKRIMQDSGARIRFKEGANDVRLDINAQGDRVLIVAGGQHQIDAAFASINSFVQTAQVNYRTYASRGILASMPGSSDPYAPQQEIHVMIPTNKCGLVIGKGGENIKNISTLTGSHVELDRRVNTDPNSAEKAFVIRGTHSQITHAAQLVCEKADIPVPSIPAPASQSSAAAVMAAYGYPGLAALQSASTSNPYAQWGTTNAYSQWQNGASDPSKASAGQSSGGSGGAAAANGQDYTAAWAAYYSQLYAQAAAAAGGGGGQQAGAAAGGQAPNPYYQAGAGSANMGGQPGPSANAQQGGQGVQDYTAAWQAYYQQINQQQLNKA